MAMVEEGVLRLGGSSLATSFLSCESDDDDDRLAEYLSAPCLNFAASHSVGLNRQTSSAPISFLPETNGWNDTFEHIEHAGDPKQEMFGATTSSYGGMSPLQDQLEEQYRAESLDFDDLIEVTHDNFPEEVSGDCDPNESSLSSSQPPTIKKVETSHRRKSVSFGLVRTHKICQGVDPPSNHAYTESTDCDLTENELCSIEVYELNYRSSSSTLTKSSSRARSCNCVDPALQSMSSLSEPTSNLETTTESDDSKISVQPLLLSSSEPPISSSSSYHVIRAADDGRPREILPADTLFDFLRLPRKTKTRFEI